MRKTLRVLSTFGTRMEEYSGVESLGYVYSITYNGFRRYRINLNKLPGCLLKFSDFRRGVYSKGGGLKGGNVY